MGDNASTSGLLVLLVEDDASMRAVLRFNLEEEGFVVVEAQNGDEAIRIFRERSSSHATPEKPGIDLVITDLKMPGKDGIAVLGEVRRLAPHVPIVIISASVPDRDSAALQAGASDYLIKPFRRSDLKERLHRLLA